MLFIHKTVSLCDKCFRHIPGNVYEKNGAILITKKCPEHGEMTSIVEIDTEFYYGLSHSKDIASFNQVLYEVTDRCQLSCPHCYHLPDNKVTDRSIEDILCQVKEFPQDCMPMFAGAEATLRKDFIELISRVKDLNFKEFSLITNGIKFADKDFTKKCYDAGLDQLCFGLNHHSYQGKKVHLKQLHAIQNLINVDCKLGYVGYTIESLDDVHDILEEIAKIDHPNINHYRIRCGSFIGRSLDLHRSYLSNLVKKVQSILGESVKFGIYDDNPYHVMMDWGNIRLRLIQWPDVSNIDMEELATGPWCQFYDGPITNFVHQVITRDAYRNMNMPKLDSVPQKYTYRRITEEFNDHHWKHYWKSPTAMKTFDWNLQDIGVNLSKLIIPIKQEIVYN